MSSILAGEYAENELRKDFTPSERVAIAEAVRKELPERRGKDNRQNFDELKGKRTDAIAAEKASFGKVQHKVEAQLPLEAYPQSKLHHTWIVDRRNLAERR